MSDPENTRTDPDEGPRIDFGLITSTVVPADHLRGAANMVQAASDDLDAEAGR
jgi:hypothetical protein